MADARCGRDHTTGPAPGGAIAGVTVLQVIPALVEGGAEQACIEIAQAVTRAGGRALVASSGGPLVARVEAVGGHAITLPLATKSPLALWRNAGRLVELIGTQGVALIHARSRGPAWSAMLAARRTGIPLVTTFHAPYQAAGPLKRAYNGVMARGERVIAISEFVAAHIQAHYPGTGPRLRVIPRAVDPVRFDPAAVDPARVAALRAAWGVPAGAVVLLLPGRLTRWKGQDVAVRALARLPPQVTLVLTGTPKAGDRHARAVRHLAEQLQLGTRVRMVGHCADMAAAMAAADVVLSCSRQPEGFGRVVAEALAMERPVVAPAHGAAPEILEGGRLGPLVPPEDPAALADVIATLLREDATTRGARGRAGRARVLERYTTAALQAATLAVYQEVLARPAAPAAPAAPAKGRS